MCLGLALAQRLFILACGLNLFATFSPYTIVSSGRIIGIIFHMIIVFKSSFVAVIVYDCLFTSPQGSKLQWIRIVTNARHGTWAIKTGAVLVESAQLVDYVCVTFSAKLT